MNDQDIVIVEGARTAVGVFMGGLSAVSATELAVVAGKAALERAGVAPGAVGAVVVGNVIQSSKDAAYLARHVGLGVGVPETAEALTVNRLCGSGMEAVVQGAKALMLGEAEVVLAGGAENMSMTPYALRDARKGGGGWMFGQTKVDDVLASALTDRYAGCVIGETVEHVAQEDGIEREAADAWAVISQARAAAARKAGVHAEEIAPVEIKRKRKPSVVIKDDEALRPETSADVLATLRPLYRPDGVVTAGNAAGLNDAAAMLVMTTGRYAKAHGLKVLGKLSAWAAAGVPPKRMALGPVPATQAALKKAGVELDAVDLIEINDAFAAQYLAVERVLGLDRAKVNVNGGCLALGHPMGATGARLLLTLLYQLRRDPEATRGLATLCIGGGMGMSALVEKLQA